MVKKIIVKKKVITKNTPKESLLLLGEKCDKCGNCCIYGSGYVLFEDINLLSKFLKISEKKVIENFLDEKEFFNTKIFKFKTIKKNDKLPFGSCILYDKKLGCKVHAAKPFHCRIGNCNTYGEEITKWFVINYLVNPGDAKSVREYAIYLKGNAPLPGAKLHKIVKDKKVLKQILDYSLLE